MVLPCGVVDWGEVFGERQAAAVAAVRCRVIELLQACTARA